MSAVTSLGDLRARRLAQQANHPSAGAHRMLAATGTYRGLLAAVALLSTDTHGNPNVGVLDEGRSICLDWTGKVNAVHDLRCCASQLGLDVEELDATTPDGQPAVELRATHYDNGTFYVLRALVPVTWDAL